MTTYSVSNTQDLYSKLKTARAGDVISLASGDYGAVSLNMLKFSSGVTIKSASSEDPAHFDSLKVTNSSNMTFSGLDIGGSDTVMNSAFKAFIFGSTNIVMDNVHVHGTMDGDAQNDSSGVRVLASSNVTIKNSEFEQLTRGVFFEKSNTINFSSNYVHDIRMDGSAFAQVKNVTIDSNRFTNFNRLVEDHSDAIQFWTTGTTSASTDIKITNNQILQGTGTAQQGIFMGNELGIPYERVTIQNNLIYESGYANGVTVTIGKNVTIKDNTVLSSPDVPGATKIRVDSVKGATISNNVTDQYYWKGTNSGISNVNNVSLISAPTKLAQLKDIRAEGGARVEGLILSGIGYQLKGKGSVINKPSGSSSILSPEVAEPIAKATSVIAARPTTFAAVASSTDDADSAVADFADSFAPPSLSDMLLDTDDSFGDLDDQTLVPLSASATPLLSSSVSNPFIQMAVQR